MVVLLVLSCGFVLLSLAVVVGYFFAASTESSSASALAEQHRALAAERQAVAEALRVRVREAEAARDAAVALLQSSRTPLILADARQAQDLVSKLCALHQGTRSSEVAEFLAPNFTAKASGSSAQLPFGGDWLPRGTPTLVGIQPVGEKLRLHYIHWFGAQSSIDALVTIVSGGDQRLIESVEFLEASQDPASTPAEANTRAVAGRDWRRALSGPLPGDILVPPGQEADSLSARDLADANDVARRFLGCLVVNDVNGMSGLSTESLQAQNPFNRLYNLFLHGGGFEKEPTLVAARFLGSECTLQYRVKPDMAPPFDIILSLVKTAGEFKVGNCNRNAANSHETRPKVEPRDALEGILK